MLSRVGGRCTGIGAAVLAVALLLTGCSGAEDPEGDATAVPTGGEVVPSESAEPTTSEASEQPTEPIPDPSPVPKPERPAAMDDTGEQGAIAAAQYFISLYNYAASTGDVESFAEFGTTACEFCADMSSMFTEIYEDGNRLIGHLARIEEPAVQPTADGLAYEVSFDLRVSDGEVYFGEDLVRTIPGLNEEGARLGVQHFESWKVLGVYSGVEIE